MKSDYDRRQVLERVASRVTLDQRGASAYVQAMASMTSDYDQRQALSALVKSSGSALDGDALGAAVTHMKSSYDKRMVLADVLRRGALSVGLEEAACSSAPRRMQSDYDRGQVLTDYVKAFGVEPALRQPFFAAVKTMRSDYERRRVLTEVAKKGAVSPDVQQAAFDVVSHDVVRLRPRGSAPGVRRRAEHRVCEPPGLRVGRRAHQVVARSEPRAGRAGPGRAEIAADRGDGLQAVPTRAGLKDQPLPNRSVALLRRRRGQRVPGRTHH